MGGPSTLNCCRSLDDFFRKGGDGGRDHVVRLRAPEPTTHSLIFWGRLFLGPSSVLLKFWPAILAGEPGPLFWDLLQKPGAASSFVDRRGKRCFLRFSSSERDSGGTV